MVTVIFSGCLVVFGGARSCSEVGAGGSACDPSQKSPILCDAWTN